MGKEKDLEKLLADLENARQLRNKHSEEVLKLKKQVMDLAIELGGSSLRTGAAGSLCW